MIYFIIGIILGAVGITVIKSMMDNYSTYLHLVKPLNKFINSPILKYTFVDRKDTLVKIFYEKNYYLLIQLDKKIINIFHVNDISDGVYTVDANRKRMDYLYTKLIEGFHSEIFENISELNGTLYSNNILKDLNVSNNEIVKEVYNKISTLDEVLEKINKSGIDSLTKEELEILKNIKP